NLRPFALLSSEELSELAQHGRWVDLAPEEVLFSQGDVGETFYVIEHGSLAVEIDGKHVRTLTVGDHLGELALLLDEPRSASVHARTRARLFAIDRPMFDTMVAEQFRRGKVRSAYVIDPIRYH